MQPAQEEQPADSPVVASSRTVDIAVSLLLLALAGLLAFDNWRTGLSWDSTGPQAGYFPFFLSLILAASSVYGIVKELAARQSEPCVRREQLRRVLQVFAPTLAFCLLMQWLGLYVASFLLVAGFMIWVGRIAVWKSLVTALVFTVAMFATFELAFDVIMPKGPLEALLGFYPRPMEAFHLLMYGFGVLLTWKTLALMMLGLVLGIFVGVLPGLGGPNGVAILLPLTFTMDPTSAIVMLSCIYWGALFGGAITSLLFHIPGGAWSGATTFAGYPVAQQGTEPAA